MTETRTLPRCLVCGFTEILTDQIDEPGPLLLAECPRCDHRWTRRRPLLRALPSPIPARVPALAPFPREVPGAA